MNDSQITSTIRHLLSAENKPADFSPLDLLQTVRLLVQHADEKDVYVAQHTIAQQLCSSPDAIQKSQKRLHKRGWIVVRKGGYKGRTNNYHVELDKLPIADLSKTVISAEGLALATKYALAANVPLKRRRKKGFKQQWAFTIDKMKKKCSGHIDIVESLCGFALKHPTYREKALRGPAELLKVWPKLVADHKAWVSERQEKAKETTPQENVENGLISCHCTAFGAMRKKTYLQLSRNFSTDIFRCKYLGM
jgi:hypothetical protein